MNIEWKHLYFVNGPTPQGWSRNDIKDGPNGWSNAYVIREEGKKTRIFVPYSCEGWEVSDDCYELERTREPKVAVEKFWMLDCIIRAFDGRKRHGLPADARSACDVIRSLGFVPPGNMSQSETPVPASQDAPTRVQTKRAPSDLTTVGTIAEGLGLPAKQARIYLRALKVEKPEWGWQGDAKWAKGITDILAKAMKDDPKKKAAP